MSSVIVVTEVMIHETDPQRVLDVEGAEAGPSTEVSVVVPRDTERNIVASIIDDLGSLDFTHRVSKEDLSPKEAAANAEEIAAHAQAKFEALGCNVSTHLTDDNPMSVVRQLVETTDASSVVVITRPQILEETFRRDLAHRIREELNIPVAHLHPGDPRLATA